MFTHFYYPVIYVQTEDIVSFIFLFDLLMDTDIVSKYACVKEEIPNRILSSPTPNGLAW